MKEIWKNIAGYEGLYQVSNLGNVMSLNYCHTGTPRLLAIKNHHTGYRTVMLCKNGVHTNKSIHILVADAFIPNPDSKPCVNHIDGNKSNNAVNNLEWVTHSENTRHAIRTKLRADSNMRGRTGKNNSLCLAVVQSDKFGAEIKRWDCISDAARSLQCNPAQIINCCKGRNKTCHGYTWKYASA